MHAKPEDFPQRLTLLLNRIYRISSKYQQRISPTNFCDFLKLVSQGEIIRHIIKQTFGTKREEEFCPE